MDTRPRESGLVLPTLPRLALGCMSFGSSAWRSWVLDEADSQPLLERALDLGITFFDTANVYSTGRSEEVLGRFLRRTGARSRAFVATKLFYPVGAGEAGLSRANVLDSCEASLRRLGMEQIDLLQIHRWDPHTPVEETMEALATLVRAGKVRWIGASNIRGWQLAKMNFMARLNGWPEFVTVQAHYNLLHREDERELLPFCADQGIAVLPWSPLARGRLARPPDAAAATGRGAVDDVADQLYGPPTDPVIGALFETARELEIKPALLAIAWLLSRPTVAAAVIGATRVGHIDDAVAALELRVPPGTWERLESAYTPRAYVDLPWTARNQTVLEPDRASAARS